MSFLLFCLAVGPLVGLVFFVAFAKLGRFEAHIVRLVDFVKFFFVPFGPRFMAVVERIDGGYDIFYDTNCSWTPSGEWTKISYRGTKYLVDVPPWESPVKLPLADLKAPPGMPSPMGLAVRAIAGWFLALMFGWVAFSMGPLIDVLEGRVPSAEGWLVAFGFMLMLYHFFGVVYTRIILGANTSFAEYEVVSWRDGYWKAICRNCSRPDERVRKYGGKIVIVISDRLRELFDSIVQSVGSKSLAAILAALREELEDLREDVAACLMMSRRASEMGKVFARQYILRSAFKLRFGSVLVFALGVLVGVAVGFAIAGGWVVSLTPPPWYNVSWWTATPAPATVTPAVPPPPPAGNVTVTPAPQPPPPTATVTVTPVQPPPPPHNVSGGGGG